MEDIFEELREDYEERDEDGGNPEDEAIEVKAKVVPPTVRVRRPRLKLDPARLLGPRGISTLPSSFSNVKFKGHPKEAEDLDLVLNRLQHWAHRLFPKMTFEDCIRRIEELGSKREVQLHLNRMRMGAEVDVPEDVPASPSPPPSPQPPPSPPVNSFDLLLPQPIQKSTELTDEQKERMMRNKLIAEGKRKLRLAALAQSPPEDQNSSLYSQPSPTHEDIESRGETYSTPREEITDTPKNDQNDSIIPELDDVPGTEWDSEW